MNDLELAREGQIERIADALERIADALENKTPAQAAPATTGTFPTFDGLQCSEHVEADGFPKWVLAPNGEQCKVKRSDGDTWYSYFAGENAEQKYPKVLKYKMGDTAPAVKFPKEGEKYPEHEAMTQAAEAELEASGRQEDEPPPPDTPPPGNQQPSTPPPARGGSPASTPSAASEQQLKRIHQLGRARYGELWPQVGPEEIAVHTNGQKRSSRDLTAAEASGILTSLADSEIPF